MIIAIETLVTLLTLYEMWFSSLTITGRTLQDVIENDDIKLDTMFKLSIAVDICQVSEKIISTVFVQCSPA